MKNIKRNYKWIGIVSFLFVLGALWLCRVDVGSQVRAQEQEVVFVVGFDAEFPPYGYLDDNGEYVGFDLDLAQEVCLRNGWTLVKRPISWDSKDSELASGSISCIWNGFTMNGREGDYTWTTPYVDNSQVVIVRKDSGIEHLSELEDKIVVVQSDSSALSALTGEDASQENKELARSMKELQQVSDYNSAFMNLESGMVDAIAMDIGVANYQLSTRGDNFVMLEEKLSTEEYGVGFKKGNTELRDTVEKTLLVMLEDGTFEEVAKKWELQDSVALSKDDTVYADGGRVPEITDAEREELQRRVDAKSGGKDNAEDNKKDGKDKLLDIAGQLSKGILSSLAIFFLTLLFAMPLGLLLMAMRMSRYGVLQWTARIYISIMRGTPLMLQLLVVFFAPYYLFNISLPYSYRFIAVIIGFSLNYAAYFAEIYRGGIQSIPQGQREAAKVMGYSSTQTFCKIIFPQMVKRVLPPVTNEVITLVKDTSLAFALAYTEMFTIAKQVAAAQKNLLPLFVAGVFYYVFNFLVAFVMEWIEKKLDYYR